MKLTRKSFALLALSGLIFASGAKPALAADASLITESAAQEAAFTNAGVTKSQVIILKVEYDADDDNGEIYDIEFKTATHKYSYEIDANDGSVVEVEKKKLKAYKKTTTSKTARISKAAAKNIALKHAGFSSNDVTFTEVKLDKDDGVYTYDITFVSEDNTEYDYEINAVSGKIINFSIDYYDDDDDDYDDED